MTTGCWSLAMTMLAAMPAAALAAEGDAAPAPPPRTAPPRYELTCWQGGVPVIQETGIRDVTNGTLGVWMRKTDGSALVLIDPQSTARLCLLRETRS